MAMAALQPTFLGDKLGGDAHLEGPEDGGVVTGDDVIGATWGEERADWTAEWRGEGGAGSGPTVGVADDVRLRVRLPQDPVAPGGNVGSHLEDRRGRRGAEEEKEELKKDEGDDEDEDEEGIENEEDEEGGGGGVGGRGRTHPGGLLLLPDVCVPGASLIAVGGGEGDLLLR